MKKLITIITLLILLGCGGRPEPVKSFVDRPNVYLIYESHSGDRIYQTQSTNMFNSVTFVETEDGSIKAVSQH